MPGRVGEFEDAAIATHDSGGAQYLRPGLRDLRRARHEDFKEEMSTLGSTPGRRPGIRAVDQLIRLTATVH
jgi:hypothetical protein